MANEIRLRPNFVAGGLSADMASGATSMSSAGLADLPAVDTTNHAALTLWRTDLAGRVTLKEIVWVTAHTAAATTATVVRGREGTTAQNWLTGDRWSCSQISSDVPVICTSVTRPTNPYHGMIIWETDTKRLVGYDGAGWAPLAGDTGWQTATMLNGWIVYPDGNFANAACYKRIGDVVFMRGLFRSTAATADTMMNLPVGYRPLTIMRLFVVISSNVSAQRLDISTDGSVVTQARPHDWVSLNGIQFAI